MAALPPTRAARLAGLRELLDHFDAHPLLPVPTRVTVDVYADRDTDGFDEIGRIAARLDVAPVSTPFGTVRAARKFGPVTLAYVYHPALVVKP